MNDESTDAILAEAEQTAVAEADAHKAADGIGGSPDAPALQELCIQALAHEASPSLEGVA